MKKTICSMVIYLLCVSVGFAIQGMYMVEYKAPWDNGYTFQEIELTEDGGVYQGSKIVGTWNASEIESKGSALPFKILSLNIYENEFKIFYTDVIEMEGTGIISGSQDNWPMNPIKIKLKRIAD